MKLSNFSLKIYMSSKNSERKNANSYPATTIKLELNSELVYNCIEKGISTGNTDRNQPYEVFKSKRYLFETQNIVHNTIKLYFNSRQCRLSK